MRFEGKGSLWMLASRTGLAPKRWEEGFADDPWVFSQVRDITFAIVLVVGRYKRDAV